MPLTQTEITDLVGQVVANANKLGLVWQLRPGEVLGTDGSNALVQMDGDTVPIPVTPIDGTPPVGTRVFVVAVPPNDNYIIGRQFGPVVDTLTDTPDGSGFLTVTHDAGFTPTSVIVQPSAPISGGTIFGQAVVDTITATTFRVRCISTTGVSITTSVSMTWVAYP